MDYKTLDAILEAIIENNSSLNELYEKFDKNLVNKTIKLVKYSQYKRNQSPLGTKISSRDFY